MFFIFLDYILDTMFFTDFVFGFIYVDLVKYRN